MPKEEEKLLGIKEAAAFLNISQNTLRHLITSHKITTSGDDLSFSQKERLKFKVKKSSFKQDRDFHRKYLPKDSPNRQLLTELLKSQEFDSFPLIIPPSFKLNFARFQKDKP